MNMKENETIYEVKFQIKTSTFLGKMGVFNAKEAHIDQYNPTRAYKTKNEAINATIQHLESLKDG